ncbi:YsnF/AvaK domain-containing protein [Paracoccus sp. (in: a-proteobacteria)]|uniref:YsnF/AvaK domain-containing protein n=1 Tax=Paracoccus sp. TaxID=267 RepID=UPI00396C4D20
MSDDRDEAVLPLIEEQLTISKNRLVTGRVRVGTQTEAVESLVPVELSDVDVDVVRVPVDRRIDTVPDIVTEGDLTIIPVVEERVVVTRELYLREEVHIRRVERRETQEVPVTIRRQTVHVERLGPDETGLAAPYPTSKDDQDDL